MMNLPKNSTIHRIQERSKEEVTASPGDRNLMVTRIRLGGESRGGNEERHIERSAIENDL